MKNIIDSVKLGTEIEIHGSSYKAIGMASYVTESNESDVYFKVFLEDHHALVLSPSDNFMYFGKDVGAVTDTFPPPDTLEYDGLIYEKAAEDYQIVREIIFGSLLDIEGEVKFVDYECPNDETKLISVGLIIRKNKRSDVVASIIEDGDLVVL